jgi:integrase/recombinase XerD
MTRRPTPIISSPALAGAGQHRSALRWRWLSCRCSRRSPARSLSYPTLLPLRGLASNPGLDWSFLAADIDDPPATRTWFLAKHLRHERPDYAYLKQVFRHLREELGVEVQRTPKRLPYVPTEQEIRSFYDAVWTARRVTDVVMIKTLLYTGVRVSELVRIRTADVDLDGCRIRINQGKGAKDRYAPYPAAFKETLALHIDSQRRAGASHLFESSWKKPYSARGRAQDPGALRHRRRHRGPDQPPPTSPLPVHLAQDPGDRRRLIQPYSGHATRQSLEIYSRIALADAQHAYNEAITSYPV